MSTMSATNPTKADVHSRSFTRQEIASLVVRGHLLVLHRKSIYRLNAWAKRHPGTSLAVLHFVGRDAVDELEAYHNEATVKRMRAFIVGQVKEEAGTYTEEEGWRPLMPPVQIVGKGWELLDENLWEQVESWRDGLAWLDGSSSGKANIELPPLTVQDLEPPPSRMVPSEQHAISKDYRKLHDRVIAEGLYEYTPFANYRWDIVRYLSFFAVSMAFYFKATSTCMSSMWRTKLGSDWSYRASLCFRYIPRLLQASTYLPRSRCWSRWGGWQLLLGSSAGHNDCRLYGRAVCRLVVRCEQPV